MAGNRTTQWIALSAGVACAAGLYLSYRSWRVTADTTRHLRAKFERLDELRRLGGEGERANAARAALEMVSPGTPPDLQRVADRLLADTEVDIQEGAPAPASDTWRVRQAVVRVHDVPMGTLGRFLAAVEGERPPWRLRECSITALPDRPGRVLADLALEALERSP